MRSIFVQQLKSIKPGLIDKKLGGWGLYNTPPQKKKSEEDNTHRVETCHKGKLF